MKKRKQKKIIIPRELYMVEYGGKEDIYWNGHIVEGTDSRKRTDSRKCQSRV